MKRFACIGFGLTLALAFGAVACGDDKAALDAAPQIDGSNDIDAMPPAATLTTFVIDLVNKKTTLTDTPVAFTTFSTLPDPDGDNNNVHAYDALF